MDPILAYVSAEYLFWWRRSSKARNYVSLEFHLKVRLVGAADGDNQGAVSHQSRDVLAGLDYLNKLTRRDGRLLLSSCSGALDGSTELPLTF